jgi:hypothetical protein
MCPVSGRYVSDCSGRSPTLQSDTKRASADIRGIHAAGFLLIVFISMERPMTAEINLERRRLFGMAALGAAAVQFGLASPARAVTGNATIAAEPYRAAILPSRV